MTQEDALAWQVRGEPVQLAEQHCDEPVQVVPSAKQLVDWHVPEVTPLQKVEQHGVPVLVQAVPSPRQLVAWQLPLTQ